MLKSEEQPKVLRTQVNNGLRRSTLGTLATRIVSLPLAAIASLITARVLGPSDQGVYSFLLLFAKFFLPILSFGLGASIVYQLSRGAFELRDVALTAACMGLSVGALTGCIVYLLYRLEALGEVASNTPQNLVAAMALLLPLQGLELFTMRTFFGQSWFGLMNWLALLRALLFPLLLIAFVGVFRWGVIGAVGAGIVSSSVITTSQWTVIRRRGLLAWKLDASFFRASLSYGLRTWLGTVISRANVRIDQFVLALFAPSAALGNYAVATRLAELLWVLPDGVSPPFFNRLTKINDSARRTLCERYHRILFWSLASLALAVETTASWWIPWALGAKYVAVPWLLGLLLPGSVMALGSKIMTKYFGASGKPQLSAWTGGLGGLLGVGLYLSLIPRWQMTGAALACSLGYTATSLIAITIYRRSGTRRGTLFLLSRKDILWLRQQLSDLVSFAKARIRAKVG